MYIEFPIELEGRICNSVKDLKQMANRNSDAICLLGDCYFDGCGGVKKNTYIGLIYYILAAACNNTRAYVLLGYYHENGQAVTKDRNTAMLLYLAAHAFGEEQGVQALSQLFFNANDTVIEGYSNEEFGRALLRYAYEAGNAEAGYYCQEYYPEVLSPDFDFMDIIDTTGILEIMPSDIYKLKKYVIYTACEVFPSLKRANVLLREDETFIRNLVNDLIANDMVWKGVEKKSDDKVWEDIREQNNTNISPQDVAGVVYSNVSNASTIYGEQKFNAIRGHGFAAERANHLYDKIANADFFMQDKVQLLGDDMDPSTGRIIKDGADRVVNGVHIQTKYCNSASKSIQECFENGRYRYINADGTPMQVEVPSDQYDGAIKAMENRIRNGEVPGVSDPKEAKNIVRKGHFTYKQAKNIAKFGTVESITYDVVNGAIIGISTFGITAVLNFAVSIWNGKSIEEALDSAVKSGLSVGGTAFATAVIVGQLTKAGGVSAVASISQKAVNLMGPKAAANLVNAFRSGTNIYGAAAMKSAQKMVGGNIVTGIASVVVLSTFDVVNIFEGRISGGQFVKNLLNTSAAVAGGTAGWTAGATVGATVGSVIPVFGTVVGGFLGGLCGSFLGGSVASEVVSSVTNEFIEDDAEEMIAIIQDEFKELASDYILNAKEAELIVENLKSELDADVLKDMYASYDRREYAKDILVPLVENVVSCRKKINLPPSEMMLEALKTTLESLD